MMQEAC